VIARLRAWRGDRPWARAAFDWTRCWAFFASFGVWGLGLAVDVWTADESRVPALVVIGMLGLVHKHRAAEKDREQDQQLREMWAEQHDGSRQ
jgi:hypothetical protein